MSFARRAAGWLGSLLLLQLSNTAFAAAPIDSIPVDLPALIRDAAGRAHQFAVNVPHRVSTSSAGTWTTEDDRSQWRYTARIDGAVSLSFHAPRLQLPADAVLTVRSGVSTMNYRNADTASGDFWSRVQLGDTLEFSLEVPTASREDVVLEIVSFQAGYRGLAPGVKNHIEFERLRMMAAGDPDTPCVENYACHVTPGASIAAQSTVALTISNQYVCSGTLINNLARDQTPYVLTTRHCQNGEFGGGTPDVASSIIVYWNAMSACGTPLASLYSGGTRSQFGATTVVEQQDTWLVRLDATPFVDDAQFAGFDASGAEISGGYTIHHALGYSRQLTRWTGVPWRSTRPNALGTTITANFWETVHAFGTFGPGASGSALFSPADRVVGVLSLARGPQTVSGYESCPVATPPAPDGTNARALFIPLASIWNSIADSTSTTNPRTLRSVLDPENSGGTGIGNMLATRLTFTAMPYYSAWTQPVTLTWSAANVTQCTASGGSTGWSGTLPGSGSRVVTHNAPGDVIYRLRCELVGGGSVSASTLVRWAIPDANPRFLSPTFFTWVSRPVALEWQAVIGPCALSGGDIAETNLAATGSITTTRASPGDVTYRLTCGVPGHASTTQHTVSYVTPSLDFVVNGTHRKVGERLMLAWWSFAERCTPTGGSPDDQWSSTTRIGQGNFYPLPHTTPGTYVYGLNCVGGDHQVQKSVTVTVDEAEPYVTLVADRSTVTYSNSPADHIRLSYKSNLSNCAMDTRFPLRSGMNPQLPPTLASLSYVEGVAVIAPAASGAMHLSITCYGSTAPAVTASVDITVLPPPAATVTLISNATQVARGMPFQLTWAAEHARMCRGTGGVSEQKLNQWNSLQSGSSGVYEVLPHQDVSTDAVYTITCESLEPTFPAATAEVMVSIGSPTLVLMGSTDGLHVGYSFTLTWNQANATGCTAGGGGASGAPWSGPLANAGSRTETASVPGQFTYTIDCMVNGQVRRGEFTLKVVGSAVGGGGSGGGGDSSGSSSNGGSGMLGGWTLALLLLLLGSSRSRAVRTASRTAGSCTSRPC